MSGNRHGSRLLAQALAAWVTITLATGGFLIVFNLSDAPFFTQLREVPYFGRMGRLLEVESGTGLVRRLIWVGDEHAGGTIGLITSDPLRLLIGWGPESMFVAFNRFYPPSLANVEARGASPDRSHQAFLDEIVTKGLLGLTAYLWLIGSFVWFCLRQLRQPASWRHHLLIIAILSAITAHLVEGLTGIPIVATLMIFWLLLGLTIAAERIERSQESAPAPEPVAAIKTAARQPARRGQQRPLTRRPAARRPAAGMLGSAGLIGFVTAGLIWWLNIQPVYADMRFQQAQSYSDQGQVSARALLVALNESIATIRANPGEDFYYLHLARTLMNLAEILRGQGAAIGDAGKPDLDALLR
ncbi:MAG: O-antigen ligase family protein, partial [Chloroflexus sp.]